MQKLVKPEKCFTPRGIMNRIEAWGRWWERKAGRKEQEGFPEDLCKGETGGGLGVAQLWAPRGTRSRSGPWSRSPSGRVLWKSACPFGKSLRTGPLPGGPVSFSEVPSVARPSGNMGTINLSHPGDWSPRRSELCILCPFGPNRSWSALPKGVRGLSFHFASGSFLLRPLWFVTL